MKTKHEKLNKQTMTIVFQIVFFLITYSGMDYFEIDIQCF